MYYMFGAVQAKGRTCPAAVSPCPEGQGASAFNQPLSFDTSSVTNMESMFEVRSTPALFPICSQALHCTLDAVAPVCWPAPRTAPYAPRSTLGRARRRSTNR